MKTRYLVALTLATAVLAPSIAGAQEQWAYTGFQPWYWLDDSQRWVYVPDQPQFVWSPDANDWIPNPMAAETFDIAEIMDQSSLSFELLRTDAELLRVTVNLSGTESGVLGLGEAQIPLEYRYRVNAISGTVELFAKLVGEEQEGAFSLNLRFTSIGGGDYTLLGDLGFSSCPICEYTGEFAVMIRCGNE